MPGRVPVQDSPPFARKFSGKIPARPHRPLISDEVAHRRREGQQDRQRQVRGLHQPQDPREGAGRAAGDGEPRARDPRRPHQHHRQLPRHLGAAPEAQQQDARQGEPRHSPGERVRADVRCHRGDRRRGDHQSGDDVDAKD